MGGMRETAFSADIAYVTATFERERAARAHQKMKLEASGLELHLCHVEIQAPERFSGYALLEVELQREFDLTSRIRTVHHSIYANRSISAAVGAGAADAGAVFA